jgi:hypothetical protein
LTPTPYAIYAANAATAANATSAGSVSAANIMGAIPLAQLPASVVTNGANGISVSGAFGGNAAGLTNMDVSTLRQYLGTIVGWGWNSSGQVNVPAGLGNVVAIAEGNSHSLALKSDGTVVGWGFNDFGQTIIPAGLSNVVAIAGGGVHSLALKSNGTVVGWGDNEYGQTAIPAGLSNVVSIAGGELHSLALKSDGTVIGWGLNNAGQATIPAGLSNVMAVAAGFYHSLALKSGGTVAGWGDNSYGQTTIPAGLSNVVAITAGGNHSLALKSNGTIVAWGDSSHGQSAIPAGLSNVVAIAEGQVHSVALKSDGTVVAWGDNSNGQTNIPAGLSNVVAIAGGAGAGHTLALQRQWIPAQVPLLTQNDVFQGTLTAAGFNGNGSGLTSLNAANLTGTVADASLSGNVALLNANQSFTGVNTFTNSVGIGAQNTVGARLSVVAQTANAGANNTAEFLAPKIGPSASHIHWGITGDWYIRSATNTGKVVLQDTGGNVGIGTTSPGATLDVNGTENIEGTLMVNSPGFTATTAIIRARAADNLPFAVQTSSGANLLLMNINGASTFSGNVSAAAFITTSDRNAKENFTPLDNREILEKISGLPITKWNFKGETNVSHVGPMAQDFYAAFGTGIDDRHIATVDEDGVALAAIQGLDQELKETRAESKAKDVEIQELKQSVDELKKLVQSLAEKK